MKKTILILLLALGAVLAVALGLALRGFVSSYVLMPVLFVAWLARLVFGSVPGWFWWAWFLIIATIIARRSLRVHLRGAEGPDERRLPGAAGQVHVWTARLHSAHHRNNYFRWLLAHDLANLAVQCAPDRERQGEARPDHSEGLTALHAPPEIASYLQAGLAAPLWQPASPLARITRPWRSKQELTPLDLDPREAVAFLERQLEVKHDD